MGSNFLNEIKILIVESSEEERKELVTRLKKYFKTIIEADNGEDAYEIYNLHNDIDLIISKINMPKLNGLELLRKVRERNLNLPFIFTTERTDTETIIEAIDLNVSYYLFKPININTLLQKIDFVCEKIFLQKRLEEKQKEIKNYIESVDNVALIFKMNTDGEIFYMNRSMQEVSGYRQNDFDGLTLNKIIHPNIPKKIIQDVWDSLNKKELHKIDTKFISKAGEEFYLNTTIFKNNTNEEEYINVAFLTTEENHKKRDFYKKVVHNIQEANKKENEYKKVVAELSRKLEQQESFISNFNNQLDFEKRKSLTKERQLTHYELQMENLNAKHDKIMYSKNEEIKGYIESVEEKKRKIETQTKMIKNYEKELKLLKEKYKSLETDVTKKNHRIVGLLDLLKNANRENAKQAV